METMMTKLDQTAKRIDKVTDIIFGLYAAGHMRRKLTADEVAQLKVSYDRLGELLGWPSHD